MLRTFGFRVGHNVSQIKTKLHTVTLFRTMSTGSGTAQKTRNRLGLEKSPYLLQHANNPVDWYPWGTEAFSKAQDENKPIFLSVGYSTCHWCHVMERESFENEEIGKILNEHFVSIKVDREERPDVDKVYMTFVQATVGSGGWPMSVWLTPTLEPLVGGTYFPPDDRYYGRPGFRTMLEKISEQWNQNQDRLKSEGKNMREALRKHFAKSSENQTELPPQDIIEKCYRSLERSYDKDMGGFGKAPKFPQPVNFSFMFKMYDKDPTSAVGKAALSMCTHTLKMMAKGGMYDYVADGFHRYSTDNDWHVPHFEKMLYDQAQLTSVYAEAYQITKDGVFSEVCQKILKYVSRDMCHKSGGFYSAEDADSYPTHDTLEKKEGAFCVWTDEELRSLLSQSIEGQQDKTYADVFCHHFGVKKEGNVDPYQDPHDELSGQNVLIVRGNVEKTAEVFGLTTDVVEEILSAGKETLFAYRKGRPTAHLDNKIITAWNGLMISGLSKAGKILGDDDFIQQAQNVVSFVKSHLYDPESACLLRSCYLDREGEISQISAPIGGFVDDYAFLIRGLLDLYEASFDVSFLAWAESLQNKMDELFWDHSTAGYFLSGDNDISIILRLKDDQDGAEPSANSVAANNLIRLSSLLEQPLLRQQAAKILKVFKERLEGIPIALPEMVTAYMGLIKPPSQIVVVGEREREDTRAMLAHLASRYMPHTAVLLVDCQSRAFLEGRLAAVRTMGAGPDGAPTAYVCENFTCHSPVTSLDKLDELLTART